MAYLTVLGHTNIDVQLEVEAMPGPSQSAPVQDRRTVYGGTACNIARHAAGLGVDVRLWSRIGPDMPIDWRAELQDAGLDLSHFDVADGGRTPTCYILTDANDDQAYCMDQGAMKDMAQHPPPTTLLDGLQGWLHVGTGDPAAYMAIADAARGNGIQVALDAGQELRFMYDPATFEKLLDKCDAVFLNDAEMDLALTYLRYGDPVQLLDHVDVVVHTKGKGGASLYRTGHKPYHASAFTVEAIDPTGAGDALRAGWYAALSRGESMERALLEGQAAAAVCVQMHGPQSRTIQPDDLVHFLAVA